ncbi:MAG: hypothetical protein KBC69_01315 [Candidatus Magasanikbacteria bacterium]|nr:hypothetical protein [Candidatus Magasanikbacteria bacterium]
MKKWLLFGRERTSKRFWYSLIGLTFFLVCSFFIFLFIRTKSENSDGFFKDWSCNNFENNKDQLIDWVKPDKKWILIGDEFKEEEKNVILKVKLGSKAKRYFDRLDSIKIFYELVNTENEQLTNNVVSGYFATSSLVDVGEFLFEEKININSLSTGKYKANVKVEFACGESLSWYENVFISYPLYVAWSFDWEGYNVKKEYLEKIDALSEKHDNLPLSHVINPRLFITKTIPKAQQDYIRDWLVNRKNNKDDSLGLHLHMFYENLEAAKIDIPKKDLADLEAEFYASTGASATSSPSTTPLFDVSKLKKKQLYDLVYWGFPYDDGYDILVTNFKYQELDKIVKWSKNIFRELGFGTPTTYRSGGWFADMTTLQVMQDNGFSLDTSGRTKYNFGINKIPGFWDLSVTSQPYQPNTKDQNSAMAPHMKIWEFPNNGADSYWYSPEQMIERFNANWGAVGEPLEKRTLVVFLTHPDWFHLDEAKVDTLFNYTDGYLHSRDSGPVLYKNLESIYNIWTHP